MNRKKRSFKAFRILVILTLIGDVLSFIPAFDNVFLLRNLSSFWYLMAGVAGLIYFSNMVIDKMLRRYLSSIGVMIILWFFLRLEKYAAFAESEFVMRQLWYAYYIPFLMIPQFSLLTALSVGTPGKNFRLIRGITGGISVALIILVLTNDLHCLVFGFNDNFVNSLTDYTHRPLYWFIIAWTVSLFVVVFITLFRKCTFSCVRKYARILPVYIIPYLIWGLLTALDMRPKIFGENFGEFPETTCFMMGGTWVLCICIGLIPSNAGYGGIFSQTHLSVWITDTFYRIKYLSASAPVLSVEKMREASPFMYDDSHIVFRKKVAGGYVFRNVDVTELNRINGELEETAQALSEEKDLIRLGNELKARQALAEEKSAMYDSIAVRVLPQSKVIEKLTTGTNENSPDFAEKMEQISVFGVYIKRMSNLMLFSADSEFLSIKELHLAVGESLRYIKKTGIPAEMLADESDFFIPSAELMNIYELFQNLYEKALPYVQAINAVFDKNVLKLTFEGVALPEENGTFYTVTNDEDISFVRINLYEAGEEI